jgi:hypothetical protein
MSCRTNARRSGGDNVSSTTKERKTDGVGENRFLLGVGGVVDDHDWIARFLPLTHALAVMRYGLLGDSSGLHTIWRMSDPTSMAAMSLGVVALFAALLTTVAIRAFKRAAVR